MELSSACGGYVSNAIERDAALTITSCHLRLQSKLRQMNPCSTITAYYRDSIGHPRVSNMARIYLKRTLSGLVPADEPSESLLRKYKVGEVYRADIVRPRSYQHHKQIMALLTLTYENLPEKYAKSYPEFDMFRYAVALEAGHADAFVTLQGEITSVPKSISYLGGAGRC
jgi:hypothetical protein